MAISKKNARQIVINDHVYHWSLSQDSGYVVLIIQHHLGQGQKLEIVITDDENHVEYSGIDLTSDETKKTTITPKIVQIIINDALKIGWKPTVSKSPLQLSLVQNQLIIRRGI